ncbi:MAG: sigma-54 dependent transcriptional regulator [Proteobacteria bacterium]|nr:sigma-54 dependent transcriptional regulator [Pseudomonadota bacterium]MCG2739121.1 sigma-54 dependent transcriptional regulator [Syntrophaceae bacterium]
MKPEEIGILIVDDEPSVRDSLYQWFKADGYRVDTAADAASALKNLQENPWDIILLDIKMPGMDGIELQNRIKQIDKNIVTIIITAYAAVDTAIQALKDGAFDYITKPVDPDDLSRLIRNAIEKRRLVTENIQLRQQIEEMSLPDEVVGESPAMKRVMEMVNTVAKTESTVMILGESGTGKELIARAIHSRSSRRYFPIITINCGAYPEGLLESELFGHEKGAFTGAMYRRKGKLEMADKGTLFLDEIGNISEKMQMDLLRVIETKNFTRLGGDKAVDVDFRVISATNKDLEKAIKEGSFREDLYYRLNVFSILLPPLRDRRTDIPLVAKYFLSKYAQSMNKNVVDFSPQAMEMFIGYDWPGNIREVRNVVERAMVVAQGTQIQVDDISFPFPSPATPSGGASLEEVERDQILKILNQTKGNIAQAAEILKISRLTIYNKIEKYHLKKDDLHKQYL